MIFRIILLFISITFTIINDTEAETGQNFEFRNSFIEPQDLIKIPQNIDISAENYEKIPTEYKTFDTRHQQKFKNYVMRPWQKTYSKEDVVKQNFLSFENTSKCYDFAYRLYVKDEIVRLNQNAGDFQLINKPAIMITSSNLRGIPSEVPCLHPDKAGGEYPFDDLQYSRIYMGFPIHVIATSHDKEWYLIYTCENSLGWIKSNTFAFVNSRDIDFFKRSNLRFIAKDDAKFKIGMFFPSDYSKKNSHYGKDVFVPTIGKNEHVLWKKTDFKTMYLLDFPQNLNKGKILMVLENLLNKSYGWGGLHGYRDCSALIRDYFTTLGIYLPRNSRMQISFEEKLDEFDIGNLDDQKKLEKIRKYGIPFRTVLYLSGHIILYLGEYKGDIIVLHSIWGQKTISKEGAEGRNVIGKSIISTLQLGKEIKNLDKTLLNKIIKMAVF